MSQERMATIHLDLTPAEARLVVSSLRHYRQVIEHGYAHLTATSESYNVAVGHLTDALIKAEDAFRPPSGNGRSTDA